MKTVHCTAKGRITFGARILVRGRRAEVAEPGIANATALKPPPWTRTRFYKDGESLVAQMDDGLGSRDLHAIANGPIMDPAELYLPAGKISMAEWGHLSEP
jgi:hypothetical protein